MHKYQVQRQRLLVAIVLLSTILVGLCGVAYAQYRQTITISDSGNKLTITADIGSISVWEHKAMRQTDGTYQLGADVVSGNGYLLIPGVDLPKDPYVSVTKTSTIEAYVYIRVASDLPDTVTFTLADCWKPVAGYDGVYVYCQDSDPVKVTGNAEVQILKDNTIYVSQYYNGGAACTLQFTAYLYEVAAGNSAASVYAAYQPQSNT